MEQGVFICWGGMRKIWIFLLLLLVGCQDSGAQRDFKGYEITSSSIEAAFQLVDHHGIQRTLRDFQGKTVALFFGYTHCPDVCPTTMADLAAALKLLGSDRSRVQVLFVTLDPERDTSQVLAMYMAPFGLEFLGLTGLSEQTDKAAKNFGVYHQKQPVTGKGRYTIDHAAGVFLLDKAGRPRVYLNYGQKPQEIAHDLRLLL